MTKTIALILIAGAFGTGTASAQPPVTVYGSDSPSVRVSYADLDLSSASGIARIHSRVRGAASDLCLEPIKEPVGLSMMRTLCYRSAVDSGFAQVDRIVADKLAGKANLATAIVIVSR